MLKIVVDTNVLLTSISSKSETHYIFRSLLEGKFMMCVTTEILLEYEEIISRHMGESIASNIVQALANLPNVLQVEKYYFWLLIKDSDDNKFADCAVASGADFLVSNDRDFRVFRKIPFPKIRVLKSDEFRDLLLTV